MSVRVCIVDGFSTGRELYKELFDRGATLFHVASSHEYGGTPLEQLEIDDYVATTKFSGDLTELVRKVAGWKIDYVIPGCENGVELSDLLSHHLHIRNSNSLDTLSRRRSKYSMHEALKEAGLRHARQKIISDACELSGAIGEVGQGFPIVVKPVSSACSDGVRVCDTYEEAIAATKSTLGSYDFLGMRNDEILLQEYLDGVQFFVNTVTKNRQHYVTDVWRHSRRRRDGGAFLFESMIIEVPGSEAWKRLVDYTCEVLDVVGMRFGASHCEIMLTQDSPVLIEVNARLMGGVIHKSALSDSLGETQAEVLAELITDSCAFEERAGRTYDVRQHVAESSFVFPKSGRLGYSPKLKELAELDSFHSFARMPEIGSEVEQTTDTSGSSGYAYFVHPDRSVVEQDAGLVLTWQREGQLFNIEDA